MKLSTGGHAPRNNKTIERIKTMNEDEKKTAINILAAHIRETHDEELVSIHALVRVRPPIYSNYPQDMMKSWN